MRKLIAHHRALQELWERKRRKEREEKIFSFICFEISIIDFKNVIQTFSNEFLPLEEKHDKKERRPLLPGR
jgi:hypothetical protein